VLGKIRQILAKPYKSFHASGFNVNSVTNENFYLSSPYTKDTHTYTEQPLSCRVLLLFLFYTQNISYIYRAAPFLSSSSFILFFYTQNIFSLTSISCCWCSSLKQYLFKLLLKIKIKIKIITSCQWTLCMDSCKI
jgi:hypothetical protein